MRGSEDLARLEAEQERLRREAPLVPDASVDVVVSNCVLNLVREQDKRALIGEIFRVLRVGGRIALSDWKAEPFAVVEGIEFRSVTVTARKGKQGPCWEGNQAVIYADPWRRVEDDDGHVLERGVRTAVCEKTFGLLTREPYAGQTLAVPPRTPVGETERVGFDGSRTEPRDPRETKGRAYRETRAPCADGGCC